jgi:hypothetical protein
MSHALHEHAGNSVCSLSPFGERVGVRGLRAIPIGSEPPHPFLDVASDELPSPRRFSGWCFPEMEVDG